jgi:hypothetical protein
MSDDLPIPSSNCFANKSETADMINQHSHSFGIDREQFCDTCLDCLYIFAQVDLNEMNGKREGMNGSPQTEITEMSPVDDILVPQQR